jgi:hypothetical protein
MRKWLAIKDNYVIDAFIWDGVTDFTYPNEHDSIMEDVEQIVGIGSWYEESEGVFYMPVTAPPDLPQEIQGIWGL